MPSNDGRNVPGAAVPDVPVSQSSSAKEPCLACGEETAVGSVFYSDRLPVPREGDVSAFLCSLCSARVRSSRAGRRMTDEEIRKSVKNRAAAAIAWGNEGFPI